jgi:hypothetical protein
VRRYFFLILPWLLIMSASIVAKAAEFATQPSGRNIYRDQGLVMSVTPRTPDQLLAFYLARGFPDDAVHHIAQRCFLTIGIRNDRNDVVWLELDNWRFFSALSGEYIRLKRIDWHAEWDRIKLDPAKRATFGWTQLPESRDLRPGEPVGGNVALPRPVTPFTLEARFHTGADKRGPMILVRIANLTCPVGEPS